MAYADTRNTARSLKAGAAVLALEAGLATALVMGLAYRFTPPRDPPPLVTFNHKEEPLPPPPPPRPHPKDDTHQTKVTPPPSDPPLGNLGNDNTLAHNDELPGPDRSIGEATFTPPPPQLPPPGPGIKARPRGNPGLWVTEHDYPVSDLRGGHEGFTRFRLTISPDGKVSDCTITGTSGYPSLDAATCSRIMARARFEPASDSTGARIEGTYSNTVHWQITTPE